jgi:hypothetical protein
VNQNQVLVPERHRHQTSNHHFPPTRNWREKMNEGMWNFNIEKSIWGYIAYLLWWHWKTCKRRSRRRCSSSKCSSSASHYGPSKQRSQCSRRHRRHKGSVRCRRVVLNFYVHFHVCKILQQSHFIMTVLKTIPDKDRRSHFLLSCASNASMPLGCSFPSVFTFYFAG